MIFLQSQNPAYVPTDNEFCSSKEHFPPSWYIMQTQKFLTRNVYVSVLRLITGL